MAQLQEAASPLRLARERQKLGLNKTAKWAHISPSHLSRVERGEKRLSLAALARLAPVIGLGPGDVAELLASYAEGVGRDH